MTTLPHGERAVIEDSKFVGYALNPHSERGQHKARVFAQVLGFNLSNWELLKRAIFEALPARPARLTSETAFGKSTKWFSQLQAKRTHGRRAHHLAV
jgi:hypothetical protein